MTELIRNRYLFGVAFSSMLAAGLRDPGAARSRCCLLPRTDRDDVGIIPRNLDPDPPVSQVDSWWEPVAREVAVKAVQ